MKYLKRLLLTLAFWPALANAQEGTKPGGLQNIQRKVVQGQPGVINDIEQAAVALHPATPFMESSTAVLVEINLQKLDVAELDKWLREAAGQKQPPGDITPLQDMIDSLQGAGTSRVYATFAPRSVADGGPIVILPCDNPVVVNGLATVAMQNFRRGDALKVHAGDKVVLAGSSVAIDRVLARPGSERPDLILPLKQAQLDHTLVFSLPKESRDVLESMWPEQMPEAAPIQFSPRALVKDVARVIVSLRLPPEPELHVHIDTTEIAATERVKSVVDSAIALVPETKPSFQIEAQGTTLSIRTDPLALQAIAKAIIAPSVKRTEHSITMNRMKQVALAIHNFAAKERHLPPRCYTDAAGKPLHSWRVALLPYLEQRAMYDAIDLAEAWNSEENQQFTATVIPTYCSEATAKTTLRAPVYPGSLWHGEGPPKRFVDVTDGTANTIVVIETPSQAAIEWANPEPWILSVDDPMSDVFGDRDSVSVVMLDGSVRSLKKSEMTNKKLIALLTIGGGEPVE
jgi:uncharacterized protein YqgV (UPF0045/DUF77 family)